MTSYNEEYEKAREVRSNAVMSIRSVRNLKIETEIRRDDLLPILFGNGTDRGILNVIALYMEQPRLTAGRKTATPDFSGNYTAQFKGDMALSVTGSGDGTDGLYPPELKDGQPTQKAQKDFNKNSKWLNSYTLESVDSPSSRGIVQFCQDIPPKIGTVASDNRDHRGPYPSQAAAQAQANLDKGTGYLGKRTENSEVYLDGSTPGPTPEDPPIENWYIGRDGIDTPDYYDFKSELISYLTVLLNGLQAFKSNLTETISAITNVGSILEEFRIEMPTDLTRLQTTLAKVNADIDLINSYITFFNGIVTPSEQNRSAINTNLQNVITDCNRFITEYKALSSESSSQLGTPDTGIRKGLVYWVNELVKKPDGPYTVLEGLPEIYNDAVKSLAHADSCVNAFSSDTNTWLSVPSVIGVFNQAVLDLDKSIKRWETHIVWKNILPANKYKLLRKTVSSFENLSNDAWSTQGAEVITELNENGFLTTEKVITPPTQHTFFRLFACDEDGAAPIQRADTFNSYSAQSDIISASLPFTQIPDVENCSCLTLDNMDVPVYESDFVVVNNETLAQVKTISDTSIQLDDDYGEITSIKKLFGFYYATEL